MSRTFRNVMVTLASMMVLSCTTPQFFTVTIYDSPSQSVRLQTMSVLEDGIGYSHPVSISEEQMTTVLQGLYVEVDTSAISVPFFKGSKKGTLRRAFSDREIEFFVPLFIKGLQQATPEEIVTFFETAEISDVHEATTSGGVFVRNNALHIILSNYGVKTAIWQDNDEYQASHRLAPLESIEPEPGRLIFKPVQFMAPIQSKGWVASLKGKSWQAAVKYKELPPK